MIDYEYARAMYYAHQRPNMSTWWTCPLTRALQIYIVQVYEAEVDDVRCACRQAVLPVRSADPACSTLQLQKSSSIMDNQFSVFQIRDQGIAFINTYYYKVSIQFSTTKMRRAPHPPKNWRPHPPTVAAAPRAPSRQTPQRTAADRAPLTWAPGRRGRRWSAAAGARPCTGRSWQRGGGPPGSRSPPAAPAAGCGWTRRGPPRPSGRC